MKPFQHTKKIIFLAFLLSLLFHLSSVIYVALFSFIPLSQKDDQSSIIKTMEDRQKINKQRDEWVETKAHAGNFGTPVFFKDYFEPSFAEAMEDRPAQIIQNEEKIIEPVIPKEKNAILPNSQPTSIATEHKPKQAPQKKIPHLNQLSTKPLSAPKPPLTLAQLTQGFLNHVGDGQNHAIHMLGKKNGTPSDEQMKYERYLQKLSWCLQNSFNIYNDRFPASASRDDSLYVLLALNQDGSVKHCHVSKTSGNRELDTFTLFIFNDASTSFPPVPQYLPHDPFMINYFITVNASGENRWKLYQQ